MRPRLAWLLAIPVCALAWGAPADEAPVSPRVALPPPVLEPAPPVIQDGDFDGYTTLADCNDDDHAVHPDAIEVLNGLDDDCDGVLDDGFDTSIDWPAARVVTALWPSGTDGSDLDEWIALGTMPRIVWVGSSYVAVWTDRADRLRLARIGAEGALESVPPLVVRGSARAPDVVWTGARLAIAYEDVSAGTPAVRLLLLDPTGLQINDVLVALGAGKPRLAWGGDRLGIAWRASFCAGDCVSFQRFDRWGVPLGAPEVMPTSGGAPAIAFSGSAVRPGMDPAGRHDGVFGIAYEAAYAFAATADVLLTTRPLEPWGGAPMTVKVNQHDDAVGMLRAEPAIAGNSEGFAVSWHVLEAAGDRACVRQFSLDGLAPVQEFTPDIDQSRHARLVWTGSEFVTVTDNLVSGSAGALEVHVRRLDSSGNSHLAAGWGPWGELNLSAGTGSAVSTDPDIATSGERFGVVWVAEGDASRRLGRLWFASVAHE